MNSLELDHARTDTLRAGDASHNDECDSSFALYVDGYEILMSIPVEIRKGLEVGEDLTVEGKIQNEEYKQLQSTVASQEKRLADCERTNKELIVALDQLNKFYTEINAPMPVSIIEGTLQQIQK